MELSITLKYPIRKGEYEVSEIKLMRPRARQFILADKYEPGKLERDFALVAACSGIPLEVLQECDIEDIGKIRNKSVELLTWYFTEEEPEDRKSDENPTSAPVERNGAE